jgi:Family of unknown function (DUF5677)
MRCVTLYRASPFAGAGEILQTTMAGDYKRASVDARREIKQRLGDQLIACDRVQEYVVSLFENWEAHGGRGIESAGEGLIVALLARSTDTFACSVRLCRNGFGAQSAMLNRSLFEDMADAHWIAIDPDTAASRFQDHYDHGRMLLVDTVASFPRYYPDIELPQFDEAERQRLNEAFGSFGHRPWSGLSIHERVRLIRDQWETDEGREALRFMHALAHRENNQTLHVSGQSLGAIVRPDDSSSSTYYSIGPRTEMVRRTLWGAYWTFTQTVGLVIDRFEISISDDERTLLAGEQFLMTDEPLDPGL